VGADRRGGVELRRSGTAVRHHHQRVAYPARSRDGSSLQSVLGIHVPRRYRLNLRRSTLGRLPAPPTQFRRHGFRHGSACGRLVLEDLGPGWPSSRAKKNRRAVLSIPYAGPWPGPISARPADGVGPGLRHAMRGRAYIASAITALMTRWRLWPLAENGPRNWAVRRLSGETPRRLLRVIASPGAQVSGYEDSGRVRVIAARRRQPARPPAGVRSRPRGVGPGRAVLGEVFGFRNAQTSGGRADRAPSAW